MVCINVCIVCMCGVCVCVVRSFSPMLPLQINQPEPPPPTPCVCRVCVWCRQLAMCVGGGGIHVCKRQYVCMAGKLGIAIAEV